MAEKVDRVVLTTDEEIVAKLQRKLEEYEGRKDAFHAPETDQHAWAKRTVLKELLRDGEVSVESFLAAHDRLE